MTFEMQNDKYSIDSVKRAKKRAKRLKNWYWMIPMNLLITATLAGLSLLMYYNGEPNTIVWILMSSPMALWVIFIIEGVVLKRPKIVRSWEERQIRKYL